jgi:hypothetical protein
VPDEELRAMRTWMMAMAMTMAMVCGCAGEAPSQTDLAGQVDGGRSTAAPPVSCFAGEATCDPRTQAGCVAAEGCRLDAAGGSSLSCQAAGLNAVGAPCSSDDSCVAGAFCGVQGRCVRYCCEQADCAATTEVCKPLQSASGTLGGCFASGPMCKKAGASCTRNSDCCSDDCHVGHCH